MLPAMRVLWAALVSLYDETITLLRANLAWLALNLPLLLAVSVLLVPVTVSPADPGEQAFAWPLVLSAWLLLLVPSPAGVGLGAIARDAVGPDAPHFTVFWAAVRRHWRTALLLFFVSAAGLGVLLFNVYFYAVVAEGWLRLAAILWLYAALFWLGLQVYLVPLLLHLAQPRLFDLYRRAALLALAHPLYTGLLTLGVLLVGVLSAVIAPLYPLASGAYVALVQAHALRSLRRHHGSLAPEEERLEEAR